MKSKMFAVRYSNAITEKEIEEVKKELGVKRDSELLRRLLDIRPTAKVLDEVVLNNLTTFNTRLWAASGQKAMGKK